MKITFNYYTLSGALESYIDFIKKSDSKYIYVDFVSDNYKVRETLKGNLSLDDKRLMNIVRKIKVENSRHYLTLYQKKWNINLKFVLIENGYPSSNNLVHLEFDEMLRKPIYNHFKDFEPERIDEN